MSDDFAAWAAELPDETEDLVKHDILRDACRRQAEISRRFGPDESRMPPGARQELAEIRRLADRL
jgi:hypothetical protein